MTTDREQVKAIVLLAQKAIEDALPEDEHDHIPEWCYVSIVETTLLALLRGREGQQIGEVKDHARLAPSSAPRHESDQRDDHRDGSKL
jgi:hypothetical protein